METPDQLDITTKIKYSNRVGQLQIDLTANCTPMDVVVAVDTSGSMGCLMKSSSIQRTLETLVGELTKYDRIALVCFAENSQVIYPLTQVNSVKQVSGFWTRKRFHGPSNLGAGVRDSLELLSKSIKSTDTSRQKHVIILTNGHPTKGIISHATFLKYLQTLHGRQPDTKIHTIGYGLDCQVELLTSLARLGGGNFNQISKISELKSTITSILDNRVDVFGNPVDDVCRDLVITLEPSDGSIVNQSTIRVGNLSNGKTSSWYVLFTPSQDNEFKTGDTVINLEIDYSSTDDYVWSQVCKPIVIGDNSR